MQKNFTLFLLLFSFVLRMNAQVADPAISMIVSPGQVVLNSNASLIASAGNFGNGSILVNTLRVTISVGTNAEILGLGVGGDPRWAIHNITSGAGNTVQLINTGGGFTSFDFGDIVLTIKGVAVGSPDMVLGYIVYTTANNPALGGAPNSSQGNAAYTNDNSSSSLNVTPLHNADPAISIISSVPYVTWNNNATINITTGNFGNDSIVSNSLSITVTTGTNSEILGLNAASDTRWSVSSLTTGNGNTIVLSNTGGSFGAFDVGDIFLNTKGKTISSPLPIIGTIAYSSVSNPGLGGPNNIQGDASLSNDTSYTSLGVHAIPVANNDISQIASQPSGTVNILLNDSDLDGNPIAPTNATGYFTVDINTTASGVQTSFTNSTGVWNYAPATGEVTYTPAANFSGIATITYQLCDPDGLCDLADITFTVIKNADFTPNIEISNVTFNYPTTTRDIVIYISEVMNNPSTGQVVIKIPKMSGFSYTFLPNATSVNVYGSTPVNNSLWTKTENSIFITLTLNPGVVIPAYGILSIGMTVNAQPNIASQTIQPITATIVNGSGGDSDPSNNTNTVMIKIQ